MLFRHHLAPVSTHDTGSTTIAGWPQGMNMHRIDSGNFDFNLLRALDVLLRERNVTRAADELHVTQQAMSGSLKRLREHFGDPLLIRVGQHLEATPMGTALITPVRNAMQKIALMLETAPTFSPRHTRRHFRIAMSDHPALTLLPRVTSELTRTAPGISYDIQPASKHTLHALDRGELDFCIMPESLRVLQSNLPRLSDELHTVPLFEDRFVCIVDENNPVSGALSREQYADMRHAALKMVDGSQTLVDIAWINAGIAPPVTAQANNFISLIFMVPGTPLVATVHHRLAVRFRAIASVHILRCPIPIAPTRQLLHWHARNNDDPTHHFVRALFQAAGEAME